MELVQVEPVGIDVVKDTAIDLFLTSSGYERRATHVACQLRGMTCRTKVALAFDDRKELAREENDKTLESLGFELVTADGSSSRVIRELLVGQSQEGELRTILVDYSCMTRNWYAAILESLRSRPQAASPLVVYFAYSPSEYTPPSPPTPNEYVGPLDGFCNLEIPDRQIALIVGLGYEAQRAIGLVDYVEAAETFALYADPALDDRFVSTVVKNNQLLIDRLGSEHVFTFPLGDLRTTSAIVASIALGLIKSYRVILAPIGPKPFVLLCLLLATRHPAFDVWRVTSGKKGNVYDRPALGPILTLGATFGLA